MNLKEKVIAEIKKIYDPEIPVNIYELGLIYDIKTDEIEKMKPGRFTRIFNRLRIFRKNSQKT